ncbi:sulfotransferase [Salinisphaera sp. S4-8]|uniref:sulfotransferase n=1 Tax=Salinisphaera sp. S4-8 TaxID=633357 RepID=UPI003340A19C
MNHRPDFLIAGAAKSGTTILHEWLGLQNDVFFPVVKEPHYFCFKGLSADSIGHGVDAQYAAQMAFDPQAYERLYANAAAGQVTGEASPGYLYFPGVAREIHDFNPQTRIICMLRNPVDRAFSQFMHHVRDGYETFRDFAAALEVENERIENDVWWGYHYRTGGFYAERLKEFFDLFPRSQIKVVLFDDLIQQPQDVLQQTCDFIGARCNSWPDPGKQTNAASGMQRVARFAWQARLSHQHRGMGRLMKKLGVQPTGRICGMAPPQLTSPLRQRLLEGYETDIRTTAKLIDRDLSHWLH